MPFKKLLFYLTIMCSCFGKPVTFSLAELEQIMTSSSHALKPFLFWHQAMPTVGLRLVPPFYPPPYPFIPHFFDLWHLAPKKGEGITVGVIDMGFDCMHPDCIMPNQLNLVQDEIRFTYDSLRGHSTSIFGLIAAQENNRLGVLGIDPHATILMIKAFDNRGTSTKSLLIRALEKVKEYGITLVNLSLKIADFVSCFDPEVKKIEELLMTIPYVIAASGNAAHENTVCFEAFPARVSGVAFDVGAYMFDGVTTYSIAPFSQYERCVGPKIVAPGFNVLSTLVTSDPKKLYGFCSGTSVATAQVTGFVALLLSEFGNDFTREQLLKVCYTTTVRLHDTQEWRTKTLKGTIDMRFTLFMLQVLRRFKRLVVGKSGVSFDFEKGFDDLIKATYTLLLLPCVEFSKKYSIGSSFSTNYVSFFSKVLQSQSGFAMPLFFCDLVCSVDFLVYLLCLVFTIKVPQEINYVHPMLFILFSKESFEIVRNLYL